MATQTSGPIQSQLIKTALKEEEDNCLTESLQNYLSQQAFILIFYHDFAYDFLMVVVLNFELVILPVILHSILKFK